MHFSRLLRASVHHLRQLGTQRRRPSSDRPLRQRLFPVRTWLFQQLCLQCYPSYRSSTCSQHDRQHPRGESNASSYILHIFIVSFSTRLEPPPTTHSSAFMRQLSLHCSASQRPTLKFLPSRRFHQMRPHPLTPLPSAGPFWSVCMHALWRTVFAI